ncbi:hypothetical protein KY363_01700 [Candidatus Woesearchaeota archaeon]|nr:hypothetical protein [Candidatus Woesearchaeota archaeon]
MESWLDRMLAERFNAILYNNKPLKIDGLDFGQSMLASYLASDVDPSVSRQDLSRAVFSSFAKKRCNGFTVDRLAARQEMDRFRDDVRTDALVDYCICGIEPLADRKFRKRLPVTDFRHELEPNISAMFASTLYRSMFRNQSLIELADTACDTQDLQALVYIDYLFRSTGAPEVREILKSEYCLESKALLLTDYALSKMPARKFDSEQVPEAEFRVRRSYRSYLSREDMKDLAKLIPAVGVIIYCLGVKIVSNTAKADSPMPHPVALYQTTEPAAAEIALPVPAKVPTYTCRGESFRTVSRMITGSSRYAKAIKDYNIDYNPSVAKKRCNGQLLIDPKIIRHNRYIRHRIP